MNNKYPIIIQAGGKGSRLEFLTTNRSKCLVPIDNKPLLYHFFDQFPGHPFIIIADYQHEVLQKYLKNTAPSDLQYKMIITHNHGTCAGIQQALENIGDGQGFMLAWCDLILNPNLAMDTIKANMVGISGDFECRWSYKDGKFAEEKSSNNGVAGIFTFTNKNILHDLPNEGEFVRYLASKAIDFGRLPLTGSREIGTMASYFHYELNKPKSRFFNDLQFNGDLVIKKPLNDYGKQIAQDEIGWYEKMQEWGFAHIPQIHAFNPLIMERIKGHNIYDFNYLTPELKKFIIGRVIDVIKELHKLKPATTANAQCCMDSYYHKTMERINKVKNIIPFFDDEHIHINGQPYKNFNQFADILLNECTKITAKEFTPIHGDPTFSNIMVRQSDAQPILIDPRGYFGQSKIVGDPDYDWAKLYYSIMGNYDSFNRKQFSLKIDKNGVEFFIMNNNFDHLEDFFFAKTGASPHKIKLLHSLIWLSLSAYCIEDYDAACVAYYRGVVALNMALNT